MLQQSHRMQTVSKSSSHGIPHQGPQGDGTDNDIHTALLIITVEE